ncbi:S-adenosyl-L-methionine-dependent methyltransferases [Klebsormidium nitens]|uniref:S-adenosyl-L-methionine-dependent methyltransferases n=1 Tax=Klebsormidium nitens TaxID=105231 RepID=A0A1Y1HTC3_KLENI|nr:S-adenosyl-L-methionine-dependent methyltransferases [Klebsormidium nitens]|eukprot:GAQ81373.1 S-adenosyl-L-methionine-dependent methyltransferases [Klebsormidium nitens]
MTEGNAGFSSGLRRPSEEGAPPEQWDAEHYAANMRFVADMAMQPLIDLLAPKQGERILDLGCGDGPLMGPIAAHGCSVVGVDYSEDMILKAQEKGLDAHVADGQSLSFDNEFDAVFTNAALHWMKRDPDGVITGVKRALKQGGRFVGEFGGHGNVAAIKTALLAVCNARGIDGFSRIPWYFPTVDEYRAKLEAQGFEVEYIELIPRPTPLPTGMAEWFAGFGNTFFEGMDEETKSAAVAEGLALLKPSLCDSKGNWTADYVRLRFSAKLKT